MSLRKIFAKALSLLSVLMCVAVVVPASAEPGYYRPTANIAALQAYGAASPQILHAVVQSVTLSGHAGAANYDYASTCPSSVDEAFYVDGSGMPAGSCWSYIGMAPLTPGGGGIASVTGTANQVTASATGGAVTVSLPSALVLPGTINKLTLTQPASGATLTILNSKTLTVDNSIALEADSENNIIEFPNQNTGPNLIVAGTNTTQTWTGQPTFGFGLNITEGQSLNYAGQPSLTLSSALGNTFLGRNAGNPSATGGRDTCLGYLACATLTSANDIVAIGYEAMYNADPSVYASVAIGTGTLQNAGVGAYDLTCVGVGACNTLTTAVHTLCIGVEACKSLTTGSANTILGSYDDSYFLVDGNNNTNIGFQANQMNAHGSNNAALGDSAGQNSSGSQSTALGAFACDGATDNSYNTCVGEEVGYHATTLTHSTILGQGIDWPSPSTNYQLDISNAIFGSTMDGGGTTISSGCLGLFITSCTADAAKLDLKGNGLAQGATTTQPGWYSEITGDSVPRVRVGLNATDVASIAFGSGAAARDTFIERAGAASLRLGGPDGTPIAQTLLVQNATGSNVAGADLTINGSRGTGTGVGGKIHLATAKAGTSGSSQNALADALVLNQDQTVTLPHYTTPGVLVNDTSGNVSSTAGTLGTAAFVNTGTSGGTAPLLNGNNVASGTWQFSTTSLNGLQVGDGTPDTSGWGIPNQNEPNQTLSYTGLVGALGIEVSTGSAKKRVALFLDSGGGGGTTALAGFSTNWTAGNVDFGINNGGAAGTDQFQISHSGSVGVSAASAFSTSSEPQRDLHVRHKDGTTNAVSADVRQECLSTGTTAAGFGCGEEVYLQNGSGTSVDAATLNYSLTTVTAGSESASVTLNVMNAGSLAQAYTVSAGGNLTLPGATQTLSNSAFTTCTALTTVAHVLTCTVSDETVKNPHGNLSLTTALAFVRSAHARVYSFKRGTPWYDHDNLRIGLYAQDVQKTLPLAVLKNDGKLQIDFNATQVAGLMVLHDVEDRVRVLERQHTNDNARISHLESQVLRLLQQRR